MPAAVSVVSLPIIGTRQGRSRLSGMPDVLDLLSRIASALPRSIAAWVTRPRLRISHRIGHEPIYTGVVPVAIPTPKPSHTFVTTGARNADLVWISITNDADRPQGDALDVSAKLWFFDDGDRALFTFPARRRDSPQVWQMGGDAQAIIDRLPIPAGYTRELDVCFKYDDELDAYALNTEAQACPDWQKREWVLHPGTYRVKVRISGRNLLRSVGADFDLIVPAVTGHLEFRLRP